MTATNRYYENTFNPVIGAAIKAAAQKAQFDRVQAAFDLLMAEVNAVQGAGGITSLSGFPASFSGSGLKYLRVNAAESAIEFVSGGRLTIKSIGGTSYTVLPSDANALLIFSNASAVTVTVPAGVLGAGEVVCLRQGNTGTVTLVGSGGAVLNSSEGKLATRIQNAQIALISDDGATNFGVIGERNFSTLNFASLVAPNAFTGLQSVPFVSLTDAATISVNASTSNNFKVTLGGNRTLANPTNLVDGCVLNFRIKQDGTGSRTLAYGTKYKFPGGTAPVLSTAAAAKDLLVAIYEPTDDILLCNMLKAFA